MKHRPQHFLKNRAAGSGAGAAHVLGSDTLAPRSVAGVDTGVMSRSVTGWEAAAEALAGLPPMQRSTEQPVQRLATAEPSSTFLQPQSPHYSLRGPPAATAREALLRERLAAQDEQRQQQRLYYFEQQVSERQRHLQHLQEQQWLAAQQQHLQHLQYLQSWQEQQLLQSAAVQPQSQSLVYMAPRPAPLGHSPYGVAPFPRSAQFSQTLAQPVPEASAESGTIDANAMVFSGGSDETQATLQGVRDILTQFSEDISQVLAQSVMAHSKQVQTQSKQQSQKQQEGDANEEGEGYAYTIGGHAVRQHHQHASRQGGSSPADCVPVHGNDAYIGGNKVNQWGELTGDDRMPKAHQQRRRHQQTRKHGGDEVHVNPESSALPSTSHLRAVSPSPHLGVHARIRGASASSKPFNGGRGARELPRDSGWPVSRPGEEGAAGLVLRSPRAATSSSPAGDHGRHGAYHSPDRHHGRDNGRVRSNGRHADRPARPHRHAEQWRAESDCSSDYYEAQRFEVDEFHESGRGRSGRVFDADAYDTADDERAYSSSGGIQHESSRGDYEGELQSEGEFVRGHNAQDYRHHQAAHARTHSRRHSTAQDRYSQRSSSGRNRRDQKHVGELYDSGSEFGVPLP